jgi:hypothetical protein
MKKLQGCCNNAWSLPNMVRLGLNSGAGTLVFHNYHTGYQFSRKSDSRKEVLFMAGKKGEVTSPKVASKAGKILSNPKSSAAAKAVAASALTQAANKSKSGKK